MEAEVLQAQVQCGQLCETLSKKLKKVEVGDVVACGGPQFSPRERKRGEKEPSHLDSLTSSHRNLSSNLLLIF